MSDQKIKRIGILLVGFENVNKPALEFLVLHINTLQQAFEFELLPFNPKDEFIKKLLSASASSPADRKKVRDDTAEFLGRHQDFLQGRVDIHEINEAPADYYIMVTKTYFDDKYYTMREDALSIIALGNWERSMAPPSVLEFILTLIIREAVASVSPSLSGSIHLGTKGCLFDFTANLGEVRNKVLNGFICQHCRKELKRDGFSHFADELTPILQKKWLGKSDDPASPAGVSLKLGYDLFATKGPEATKWEKFLVTIQDEGVKQLIKIVGGLIIAGLFFWLGLK